MKIAITFNAANSKWVLVKAQQRHSQTPAQRITDPAAAQHAAKEECWLLLDNWNNKCGRKSEVSAWKTKQQWDQQGETDAPDDITHEKLYYAETSHAEDEPNWLKEGDSTEGRTNGGPDLQSERF